MRKELFVNITDEGRDKGKLFKITEAPAIIADKWGIRAMLALNRNGAQIPDEIMKLGLVGVLVVGVHKLKGVLWEDLEPLLDEMLSCIEIVPTPQKRDITRRLFTDPNDIEEVSTLSILRKEVFTLHVGFTKPAAQSGSPEGQAGAAA
jgi:hypothetical protein